MADYVQKLRDDLVEQFKGKPVIDALMEAVGDELNEVRQFYEDLRDKRNIQTAVGKQLDGIGDNAVLTRLEAGALACAKESVYVLDDDAYRTYLIYKIWKNTNNCTYYDIIRAFKMFWDKPLHYREDPAIPATMIFETDDLTPEADVSKLLNAPFIKAAGVAILVVANTEARNGRNHLFTNQTAANGFAFNFRVTAERGASGESGYIASIQGGFQ